MPVNPEKVTIYGRTERGSAAGCEGEGGSAAAGGAAAGSPRHDR